MNKNSYIHRGVLAPKHNITLCLVHTYPRSFLMLLMICLPGGDACSFYAIAQYSIVQLILV